MILFRGVILQQNLNICCGPVRFVAELLKFLLLIVSEVSVSRRLTSQHLIAFELFQCHQESSRILFLALHCYRKILDQVQCLAGLATCPV